MGANVDWGSGAKLMLDDDTVVVVFEEGTADDVPALLDAKDVAGVPDTETCEGVDEGVGVGDALVVWSAVVDMSTLKFVVTSSAAPVNGSVPTWIACTNCGRMSLSLVLPYNKKRHLPASSRHPAGQQDTLWKRTA